MTPTTHTPLALVNFLRLSRRCTDANRAITKAAASQRTMARVIRDAAPTPSELMAALINGGQYA